MMTHFRAIGKSGKVLAEIRARDLKAADGGLATAIKVHGLVADWKASGYAVDEYEDNEWVRVAGENA